MSDQVTKVIDRLMPTVRAVLQETYISAAVAYSQMDLTFEVNGDRRTYRWDGKDFDDLGRRIYKRVS